ncbi:MAG: hypothetical protein N3D20_02315 [Candidatus Pacearchaeota archaeon]|nr:hypothetical protein [Candidatus Pacearchaeota archaeon]
MELRKYDGNGAFYTFGGKSNPFSLMTVPLISDRGKNVGLASAKCALNSSLIDRIISTGEIRLNGHRERLLYKDKNGNYFLAFVGRNGNGNIEINGFLANPKYFEIVAAEQGLCFDEITNQKGIERTLLEYLLGRKGGNIRCIDLGFDMGENSNKELYFLYQKRMKEILGKIGANSNNRFGSETTIYG